MACDGLFVYSMKKYSMVFEGGTSIAGQQQVKPKVRKRSVANQLERRAGGAEQLGHDFYKLVNTFHKEIGRT